MVSFAEMYMAGLTNDEKARLRRAVDSRMAQCDGLRDHCDRCLATERWSGSVTLMVVDAAFMSIGLNYFTSVVPAVAQYESRMKNGELPATLDGLSRVSYNDVAAIWRNRRSWSVAQGVAARLADGAADDRSALREWAIRADPRMWQDNPVGAVPGVGINTYQYLRMMGGIDTSMPDKIVRRVVDQLLQEARIELPTRGDGDLIETIDYIAHETGYRAIELCWMTWMVQSEGNIARMEKYRDLLKRI